MMKPPEKASIFDPVSQWLDRLFGRASDPDRAAQATARRDMAPRARARRTHRRQMARVSKAQNRTVHPKSGRV